MAHYEDTVWCDGCGVEVVGAPVVVDGLQYCCQDCADGLECDCRPELERKEEEQSDGNA